MWKVALAVPAVLAAPDLPGWTDEKCTETFPVESEVSENPGPAGGTMSATRRPRSRPAPPIPHPPPPPAQGVYGRPRPDASRPHERGLPRGLRLGSRRLRRVDRHQVHGARVERVGPEGAALRRLRRRLGRARVGQAPRRRGRRLRRARRHVRGRSQGRKRVMQRRFNVGVLEAISKRKASTLRARPER